jgi:hypothetical protein
MPKDTFAFTLAFLGADPAAYRRQAIFLFQDGDSFRKLSFADRVDEFGNIDVHGTTRNAHGFGAVQAALRLIYGRFLGVTGGHLVKIMFPHLCRLFRHRVSHSSTHLQ